MKDMMKDINFSARVLRRNPGFSITVLLALALGIGTTSAIFSAVNGVLLRPLPYNRPDQLLLLYENNKSKGWKQVTVSPPNFLDLRARSQSFAKIAAFRAAAFNLKVGDEPERVVGARVSADLFTAMGVEPKLGRAFTAEEDQSGHDQVALLSYAFWQEHFRADGTALGKTITLDDKPFTIIGVMPETFRFPGKTQIWTPIAFSAADLHNRGTHFLGVVARLKPDLSLMQAQGDMDKIAQQLQQEYPNPDAGMGISIVPLHEAIVGKIRLTLVLLLGAVAVLLLIACANIASLFIVRISSREKEMAVRAALGATPVRLVRQLLTESLLLGLGGGALGIVIALLGVHILPAISPKSIPRADTITMDGNVLGFTLLVSLFTGVLFGIAPALFATKVGLSEALAERSEGTAGHRWRKLRSLLVVSEVALALIMLISAGLLIRSLQHIHNVDLGFRTDNMLTMEISLPRAKYPDGGQQRAFVQEAIQRISSLPQVESAGVSTVFPSVGEDVNGFVIEGPEAQSQAAVPSASYFAVTPGYFRTMGIPLIKGRVFEERDSQDAPRVVIINSMLADRYFPGTDPIGKRMHITYGQSIIYREIVGVVGNVHQAGAVAQVNPQMYEPFAQAPRPYMMMIIHTAVNPSALAKSAREQLYAVDASQPAANVRTVEEIVSDQISQRRLVTVLLVLFSSIALVLAGIGTYGLLTILASQRRRELGVRIALGASRAEVFGLMIQGGLRLVLIGAVLGLAGSMLVPRIMSSLLFGVGALDLLTFIIATLLLLLVALVACFVPAWRASRVDPVVILQQI